MPSSSTRWESMPEDDRTADELGRRVAAGLAEENDRPGARRHDVIAERVARARTIAALAASLGDAIRSDDPGGAVDDAQKALCDQLVADGSQHRASRPQ